MASAASAFASTGAEMEAEADGSGLSRVAEDLVMVKTDVSAELEGKGKSVSSVPSSPL